MVTTMLVLVQVTVWIIMKGFSMRIKGKMNWDEFKNVCNNKGIESIFEIKARWDNYRMALEGLNDGRTSREVGAGRYYSELDVEDSDV